MAGPAVTSKTEFASGAQPRSGRIVSIDALRGFDMFWIIGADEIARGLGKANESGWAQAVAAQLKHVRWEGFVFYDLIFPLFVFLLGMGIVFSLDKIIAKDGLWGAHKRIFRRFLLLFLFGALYDEGFIGLPDESPFSGVLQRLAWCYLFTSLLYCHLGRKALAGVLFTLLLGYWLLVAFVPPPGADHVDLRSGDGPHLPLYIDEHYLPFKEAGQKSDPEGLMSTIPAVASCLLGLFAGLLLMNQQVEARKKILIFLGAGAMMVVLGYTWGWLSFPVVKRIWSSSYVLVAGGYSAILVGLFYLVVDHLGYRQWATPFIWIGVNPLTLYLLSAVVDFHDLGGRLAGGPVAGLFGTYGELWVALVGLVLIILVARFFYKKGIFLRV